MLRRANLASYVLIPFASLTLAAGPTSRPSDAWPLYSQAIQRVAEGDRANIMSPAASPLEYPEYPPYSAEWHKMETASCAVNAPARTLVREARSRDIANWPVLRNGDGKPDLSYLTGCRNLANEVGDAALEQHLRGDDAAAVESVRDLLHLSDLVDGRAPAW